MRLIAFVVLIVTASVPLRAESPELLNATLVTRLHFDQTPRNGQMVGAYQVSFRNTGDTPINQVSLLLNPGLRFQRIAGPDGRQLNFDAGIASIEGTELLELNRAVVTLPAPLTDKRIEITINFRGYLEDLSLGLPGVSETLHPDFSMIRAQGFGYPVFAEPDMESIERAWGHKPFYQVAFIDMPGTNVIFGTHQATEKGTSGGITKFEMNSARPTGLMALAIGPYRSFKEQTHTVAFLPGDSAPAGALSQALSDETTQLTAKLGPPPSKGRLTVAEIPSGIGHPATDGLILLTKEQLAADTLVDEGLQRQLLKLWRFNTNGRAAHWADGLDGILVLQINDPAAKDTLVKQAFGDVKTAFGESSTLAKTALADYAIDGFAENQEAVSTIAFAVLFDLLGEDAFFALVRGLRAELSNGYADMEAAAAYLIENIKDKKARSFARNWFEKGRAGKDMAKADSIADIVARYR